MKHLIFWQQELSPHQSAHLRALARLPGCKVTVIAEGGVPERRLQLGWREPDLSGVEVVSGPMARGETRAQVRLSQGDVHIVSGLRSGSLPRAAFDALRRRRAFIGIMAEALNHTGPLGPARRIMGTVHGLRFRNAVEFVLAIGGVGVRWYRQCGFPESKVYPYGYFMERPPGYPPAKESSAGCRLVFVGSLIRRKGLDLLLAALAGFIHRPWSLTVIGDGPSRAGLAVLAERLGIENRVCWEGVCANERVSEALASADALVLPSRFDGWGAVVNEALMAGVPAICSDVCGAAQMIRGRLGDVFAAGNVSSLASVLARRIEKGPIRAEEREAIRAWSQCIGGDAAARYLVSVLDSIGRHGPRPGAPWLIDEPGTSSPPTASPGT